MYSPQPKEAEEGEEPSISRGGAYDTLDRVLEMASESSELERLSQEIADRQLHLRGAKSVESFDLANAIEREIADMEERRRKLLDQQGSGVAEEQGADASEPVTNESLRATVLSFSTGAEPNERIGWERLTPEDVDRAKQEVERQRIEMLARHAEELHSLEAEATELDSLEQAIDLFMRKFGATAVTA
jgi:hypothetical protein